MRFPLGPELLLDRIPASEAGDGESRSSYGVAPLLALAVKPVGRLVKNVVVNAGDRAEKRERREAQDHLEHQENVAQMRATILTYREAVRTAPSDEARKRAVERLEAAEDRLEEQQARHALRKRGHADADACMVLEERRNRLAKRWERATPDQRVRVEARIAEMDGRLRAAFEARQPPKVSGSAMRTSRDNRRALSPEQRRVRGEGGLSFDVQAPPGPGRLVRIPFYPATPSQAWVGANGIDEAGDCPILDLQIPVAARVSNAMVMRTPNLDYAMYRIVGLQVNLQESYRHTPVGGGADDVAIGLFDFTVYNGSELFAQGLGAGIDARTFSIRQLGMPNISGGTVAERPFNWDRRRSRFFVGLRDFPVMTTTAQAQMTLRAHMVSVVGGLFNVRVPITVNLVVDVLEDQVIGNPVVPSPASRAGAVMEVSARNQGRGTDRRTRLEIRSSRYAPPR